MILTILRSICLSFPAVTEDVKWESNLCSCVSGKIFCIANLESPYSFSFKVTDEEFGGLSEAEGFAQAPYLAKAKWVIVNDSSKLNQAQLKVYMEQSYNLIRVKIPKNQRKKLGI